MNLSLRQLEAFVALARLGSFTRAAGALHISQPGLTLQIRQLESALGVRLFDRTTRSVALTQVGREFVPVLERVLAEIKAVTVSAREVAARRRGTVTVAAFPSVAHTLLPMTIASFRARHPGITVRLRDVAAQRVLAMVKSGAVDFGLGSADKPDPELTISPLFTDRMVVVFPPGHALERKRRIVLQDLTCVPLILTDPESSARTITDRAFESIGHAPVAAFEANYAATAFGLVRAGLGIAILPAGNITDGGRTHGVRVRDIEYEGFVRSIGIVERAGRSLSPAAAEFAKALRETCKTVQS